MGLECKPSSRRIAPLRRAVLFALCLAAALTSANGQEGSDSRRKIVEGLLDRSRLLDDVHFRIPRSLWLRYKRMQARQPDLSPVACISERGTYRITIDQEGNATLSAEVRLHVFDPSVTGIWPVLTDRFAWRDLSVQVGESDPLAAHLSSVDGYLRYHPLEAGLHVIRGHATLPPISSRTGLLTLQVCPTALTHVAIDSPRGLHVVETAQAVSYTGSDEAGTHASLPLATTEEIRLRWRPPTPQSRRPAALQLRGNVAWNLDAGRQQVAADLTVAILGGSTDRLVLHLPAGAQRAEAAGPDVREARLEGGDLLVHLRGSVSGKTALRVSFEQPATGDSAAIRGFELADGRWAGGTVIVLNSAGGSEILPAAMTGLSERAISEIPPEASGLLPGEPVLGFAITGGAWSAGVDVLDLGEFALQETIADTAHFELVFVDDGTLACRASYELRNRDKQYLRIALPSGSRVLAARVNDIPRPVTSLGDDEYLIPLERSTATVMGLVSFPVEIVLMRRQAGLTDQGALDLTLPRLDVPIAYAWCEAFVPEDLRIEQWRGGLNLVERFSRDVATDHLAYGRAEAAPTASLAPDSSRQQRIFLGYELARNYWYAGREQYEQGDLAGARASLEKVHELAPNSPEAERANKLLANVKLATGEQALESRAQRAAGVRVLRRLEVERKSTEAQQQKALTQGFEAARAGQHEEAAESFRQAESLGRELIRRGASAKEQAGVLKGAQTELARASTRIEKEADRLGEEVTELKLRGRYSEALDKARSMNRLRGTFKGSPAAPIPQEQLDELAVLADRGKSSTPYDGQTPRPTTQQTYDVRDLLAGGFGGYTSLSEDALRERAALAIRRGGGGGQGVSVADGKLVVQASPEDQEVVANALSNLRAVRGPQVDVSEVDGKGGAFPDGVQSDFQVDSPALQEFLSRNYLRDRATFGAKKVAEADGDALVERLAMNLGQKVPVSSARLSNRPADLAVVGAEVQTSPDGKSWAVLDEAQFRTLAGMGRMGEQRSREAIVGTESVLANEEGLLVTYADSSANRVAIGDTTVDLPHEKYLVIVDDDGLTIVRSGKMRHWTERGQAVVFETGPEPLVLPRVGREVKFERALVRPTDRLVVTAQYSWKGNRR